MKDNSVIENNVIGSKKENLISIVIILFLMFCSLISFLIIYFSYLYDVENYDEKKESILDGKFNEDDLEKVKDVYHLHVLNGLEYISLIDSNIMTLFYSNEIFEVESTDYNPAVIFYIMKNNRNKLIVNSNISFVSGLISFDEASLKQATYNVFGNNFEFSKSKIYDMNSCPSLSFNSSTNKYDIGLSCGDTSGVLAFTKVYDIIVKDDEIQLYEKVLFVFGDTVKDKYLDGNELGKIENYDSVWDYEDSSSIYKYTFNKDENDIFYLKKVEYVKNTI